MNDNPYALYRYFDAECVLLYLGKSGDLARRQQSHIARAKWMQFAANSTIERYETPEELATAERIAIEGEHPIFNKQYNDTSEAKARLRAYLERAGRLDLLTSRSPRPSKPSPPLPPAYSGIREHHERSLEFEEKADREREMRDQLVRSLREEDPRTWSYAALAVAAGCSRELIAYIVTGRKQSA